MRLLSFTLIVLTLWACKPMGKVSSKSYVGKEFETESGLKYTINRAGTGKRAEAGNLVVVNYAGRLLDSTQFDNSYDKGRPFRFELGAGKVIKGWDEGIALLNEGDSATLVIPPHLGYGERQAGKIKPNSTLIFDVELLKVIEPAKPFDVKGKDTVSIADGLSIIWLKKAEEGEKPQTGQTVQVNYSGYFTDYKKFDSSVDKGVPFEFPIGQGRVIKGWDLGIAELRKGDVARLLIAPEMGYGAQGYPGFIPPNAKLIFDVELLDIK